MQVTFCSIQATESLKQFYKVVIMTAEIEGGDGFVCTFYRGNGLIISQLYQSLLYLSFRSPHKPYTSWRDIYKMSNRTRTLITHCQIYDACVNNCLSTIIFHVNILWQKIAIYTVLCYELIHPPPQIFFFTNFTVTIPEHSRIHSCRKNQYTHQENQDQGKK